MVGVGTVVDAAIGWLVESILGNFFGGSLEAWIRGVGLDEDVEELKAAVRSVQMVVAAAKGRKIENEPLARSLDDLKELLYDADDVIDELDYYRLKLQVETDNSRAVTPDAANNTEAKSTWLPSSIRQLGSTTISSLRTISSTGSSRGKRKREDDHDIAASSHLEILENKSEFSTRIKHIVKKLRDLDRDVSKAMGIDGLNSAGISNLGRYHDNRTTSYLVELKVYGRDAEMESIFKLMENNRSNDITVLPIVGVGGVGKTTLAQFVYQSPMVESQFQIKIWICVSDKFDVTRLIREMLECASRQKQAETGNLNKLQEDLERHVKSRRFLIVFDDVWDDMNEESWKKLLLAPLRRNQAVGNMILVTTRKSSVAEMTKTIEPVMLNALKTDDFWLLFKSCAFGNEEYEEDEGLCFIGKQIAEDLGGNPLAAKTVGALLKRNINVDNWTSILSNKEWKSLEVNGIMPALKLSYDHLPQALQQCYRYCCLFPKDYHFEKTKLIRIWISQGFVHGSHTGKKQEDAGKDYLTYLVNSGFFQHVSYSSQTFVMHDLLHDLACQLSRADLVSIDGSEYAEISPTTRHLSIVFDSAHSEASENFERKLLQITSVRKLRSLVLIGDYDSRFSNCLKNIFKEANNLRYLKIEATYHDFVSFFSNLGSCTHVRYIELDVSEWSHIVLPEALVNFFHLQVLEVSWGIPDLTLPSGMSNLVSMQHLIAPRDAHSTIANIGKMTALQELYEFKVHAQNDSRFELKQLQSMSQLVKLGIYQLENVQSKQEASEARLTDKVYLEEVCLSWDNSSTSSGPSTETATNVLEGLRPHRSLKHLQIIGYNGSSSPSWLDVSVTSLRSLCLEKCKELGVILPLQKLIFLRKLELINMPGIVEVDIPCLEELMLIEMPRLEKCVATSNSELNCRLQSLHIKNCPELKEFAPFTSENFCSFDVIQNSGMSRPESKSAELSSAEAEGKKWLPVLRILMIHGCPRLKLIHALPPSSNTQLSIEGLPTYPAIKRRSGDLSVKSSNDLQVFDAKILAFQNLKDVTSVKIKNGPNLVFLCFEGFRQLNNVRNMTISKCGNLISFVPKAISETWEVTTCPAFPHLKYLKIESCGGIGGKWLNEMLLHMQSLEVLHIVDCPKIKSLSIQKAENHNLASSSECEAVLPTILAQHELHLYIPLNVLSTLQEFHIERCPEMQLCGSRGFGGFISLTKLDITECPMLLSSADERFSLPPSVTNLRIINLPKNLHFYFPGGRTFLKELEVDGCPDLQSLCLDSCTALERLWIGQCTQLAVLEGLQYLNSLGVLSIIMNPELSRSWVRKCQEVEQRSGDACLLPPSLENLIIGRLQVELGPYLLAHLPCLSNLNVYSSPNLTSLQLGSLAALKKLCIRNCDSLASLQGCLSELEECKFWYQDLTSLQPGSLTALKHLNLDQCTSLASLERHFLGDLIDLEIHDCSSSILALLEILSRQADSFSIFPRLERLSVDYLSVLATSLCKPLTSLRCLELSFLEWGACFTDEQEKAIQLLTSLQELKFYSCQELTDLPAILHNLDSLKRLEISFCPRISRLPEKGLPPSLEELAIRGGNAQLKDQCRMLPTEKLKVTIN
ncbi:unnamed protein product [Urochloa decumbens]|uniref:Uncharacterized protein n=1 Tax=Urochloa decumbens TaxID=240449 RepID=A0ABC9B8R9_9POAL